MAKKGLDVPDAVQAAILAEYDSGVPVAEIAERYTVGISYPTQLAQRFKRKRRTKQHMSHRRSYERPTQDGLGLGKRTGPVADPSRVASLWQAGHSAQQICAITRWPYREVQDLVDGFEAIRGKELEHVQ